MDVVENFLSGMGQVSTLFGILVTGQFLVRLGFPASWRARLRQALLLVLAVGLACPSVAGVAAFAFLAAATLVRGGGTGLLVLLMMVVVRLILPVPVGNGAFLAGLGLTFLLVCGLRAFFHPAAPYRFRSLLLCGLSAAAGAALDAALVGGAGPAGEIFVVEGAAAVFFCWLVHLEVERLESAESRVLRKMRADVARRGLMAGNAEFVARMDMNGRVLDISPSYLARMGYARDEVRGRSLSDLRADGQGEDVAALVAQLQDNGAVSYEISHRTRAGESVPFDVTAISAESGDCFYTFLRDISERRRAEQAIAEKSEALRDALEKTIAALSTTLGAHSLVSGDQVWRIRELVERLGQACGLDAQHLEGLGLAAMVHDIGEIATPVEILNRPRRLNDDEMELVRAHCEAGYNILKDIRFPWPIAEIIWQHHENYDGSGYPRGLAGPAILPEARIIRVADSVMAMLSHRPFRRAFDRAHVIDELLAGAGRLYDPAVVEQAVILLREDQTVIGTVLAPAGSGRAG